MMTPERLLKARQDVVLAELAHDPSDRFVPAELGTELLAEIDRMTAERNQLSNALDLAAAELESATQDAGLYLSLLRESLSVIRQSSEWEFLDRPDVAEFLREEEAQNNENPLRRGEGEGER